MSPDGVIDRSTSIRALARNRPFLVLWSSYSVSLLGNGLTSAALALLAHQLVGGEASMIFGIALTIRIIGRVVASPFSPLLAEKFGSRILLASAALLSAGITLTFIGVNSVWQIYLVVLGLNLVDAVFVPLYKSVIPGLVGTRLYPKAQALGTVSYELSNVAAPALAALAIAWFGFRTNFVLDALTFLLVAIAIGSIRELKQPAIKTKEKERSGAMTGFRMMWKRIPLRLSLIYSWITALAGSYVIVATISYAMGPLNLSAVGYAWIMAAFGLGSTLGALLFGWMNEHTRHTLFRLSPLAMALGLGISGLGESVTMLALAWIISGLGYGMANVGVNQMLAEHATESERPHVFAAQFSFSHAAWGLFYPLAGWTSTTIGFMPGAILFTLVIAGGMLWIYQLRRNSR
ncbi:MFS transporter [Rubellicoccus peritrichatus]|uniref:MFS transporter n=1 Tax=Rubellicoccus peritrichatus TaxID=3080537 RepID=A0AAQ3LC43_9BACT|nr:MFS transporter [Puniceicoccus sp. CR14]WOO43041.1 MFS transporter [Puniceicoccus sp. CR14]